MINGIIIKDTRRYYKMVLPDGRTAGTKADSEKEARCKILKTLEGLKYDILHDKAA